MFCSHARLSYQVTQPTRQFVKNKQLQNKCGPEVIKPSGKRHCTGNSTTGSVPGYAGKFSWYFAARSGGTKRPPRKCRLPWNKRAHCFGAVSDTRTSGCSPCGSPVSISQPATHTIHVPINQQYTRNEDPVRLSEQKMSTKKTFVKIA